MDERVKSQKKERYFVIGSLLLVNTLILAPLGIYKAVDYFNNDNKFNRVERTRESDLKLKIEKN